MSDGRVFLRPPQSLCLSCVCDTKQRRNRVSRPRGQKHTGRVGSRVKDSDLIPCPDTERVLLSHIYVSCCRHNYWLNCWNSLPSKMRNTICYLFYVYVITISIGYSQFLIDCRYFCNVLILSLYILYYTCISLQFLRFFCTIRTVLCCVQRWEQ